MGKITDLSPKNVWIFFDEIRQVPRPSKKEEKIIQYLLAFGKKYGIETHQDKTGNVLFRKPASKGKEKVQPVILQSHMDMVCEKNTDVHFDFENDPIEAYVDGDWVKAKGTTLGADDGIGMAAQLALLADPTIEHGPLECLITMDEESGMTGAKGIEPGFLQGKILLNLDSEDEGELCIGCAGGLDSVATFHYKEAKVPDDSLAFNVSISGLKGGHSGDDIQKGLGNSNKILTRFLWELNEKIKIELSQFDGGNLRNAIPREATAIFTVKRKNEEEVKMSFEEFSLTIKDELHKTEPNLALTLSPEKLPAYVIHKKIRKKLLRALYAGPHGVYTQSREIEGLPETSTNMASVKFQEDHTIKVSFLSRGSKKSLKWDLAQKIENVFRLAGAKVEHSGEYPGWSPDSHSNILDVAEETYKKRFGITPRVMATHAGLECGLIKEKYPELDMISFGPTLRDVHSPDEKIQISTVQKFWDYVLEILKNIPEK